MFITILFLFIVMFLAYHYYVHYEKKGRLIDLIPGPPFIPIFGNILEYQVPHSKLKHIFASINFHRSIYFLLIYLFT